jgi:aspartate 1-decarboxylase
MLRNMCKSKIHRARVTDSNLNYVGSITIDEDLMNASNIIEYEEVHVLNINNGARFVTYALKGKKGSGVICINGAASRLVQKDDLVIIASYAAYSENELKDFVPQHIFVDHNNAIAGNCLAIFQEQMTSFKTAEILDE